MNEFLKLYKLTNKVQQEINEQYHKDITRLESIVNKLEILNNKLTIRVYELEQSEENRKTLVMERAEYE